MHDSLQVALVGVGGYGAHYARCALDAQQEGSIHLVGAAEPRPEGCPEVAQLREAGVPVASSLNELLDQASPDLVIISSPIHYHCAQTCRSLEAGAHVLCEKPAAATVQEVQRMQAAEEAAERFVAIGYQWSFADGIQALKRDIAAGVFGRPKRLQTLVCWPRRETYYRRNNWAGRVRDDQGNWVLDSPVNNATAHYLHNMFYVLGDAPDQSAMPVNVTGELYRANDIENFDAAALRAHTAAGVEVLFFAAHCISEQIGPRGQYEFENAVVVLGEPDVADGGIVATFHDGTRREYGNPAANVDGKFDQSVAAAREGGRPVCGLAAASAQTLCLNGLQDSCPEPAGFPSDRVHVYGPLGDKLTAVEGLAQTFTECFEAGVLPAERDVPWARAGEPIDLRHYDSFPQRPR